MASQHPPRPQQATAPAAGIVVTHASSAIIKGEACDEGKVPHRAPRRRRKAFLPQNIEPAMKA